MTDTEALAQLIIHMSALIVWALSGKSKRLYEAVRDEGTIKWEEIKER